MQRIGSGFLQNRSAQIYIPQEGGGTIKEVIELPNGQWQFGRGKDAVVVTDIEQVKEFGEDVQTAVARWLDRVKRTQSTPVAVQDGQIPPLHGLSARDQLGHAISRMPDEVVNRLLLAVTQTIAPVADSIMQESPVNHHSDGFGQDQPHTPVGSSDLPPGAWWVDPSNKSAGFYTPDTTRTEDVKLPNGQILKAPTKQWHPSPETHQMIDQTPERTDVEAEMDAERVKFHEEQLAVPGRRASRRR